MSEDGEIGPGLAKTYLEQRYRPPAVKKPLRDDDGCKFIVTLPLVDMEFVWPEEHEAWGSTLVCASGSVVHGCKWTLPEACNLADVAFIQKFQELRKVLTDVDKAME